jgi:hypothetical protein
MFQTLGKSFNGESSTGIGLNLVMKLIEWCFNITNNSDVGCDFVISNLEIASNKASLLLDLTKKYFKNRFIHYVLRAFLTKIIPLLLKVYQFCVILVVGKYFDSNQNDIS